MRFDLGVVYSSSNIQHRRIEFKDCYTVADARAYMNCCSRLIDIGNIIHNLDNIHYISIELSEEVDPQGPEQLELDL